MADSKVFTLSADKYRFWTINHRDQTITVALQDGRTFTEPMSAEDPLFDSEIAISIFDWEKWWVTSVTRRDHIIFAEAFSLATPDPLKDRPSVYLDQNHWSKVAFATIAPERVKSKLELEAALELIRLVTDAGIVMPLSSAHMLETSSLYGDKRYEVGVAMSAHSGGWQLRHPMTVWHQEASRIVCRLYGMAPSVKATLPVVTLDPNALLSSGKRPEDLDPRGVELFFLAISSPGVMFQILLQPEREDRVPMTKWVKHHAAITRQFEHLAGPIEAKRKTALRRFWNENLGIFRDELRAMSREDSVPGMTDRDLASVLESEPMLRYLSGLFARRFLDSNTNWKDNDLVDMLFLSCAAGYVDYVAAEKHTGSQLRQIQQALGRKQTVFSTLHDLVGALTDAGVTTASEREADAASGG